MKLGSAKGIALILCFAIASVAPAFGKEVTLEVGPYMGSSSTRTLDILANTEYTVTVSGTITAKDPLQTCVYDLYYVACNTLAPSPNIALLTSKPPSADGGGQNITGLSTDTRPPFNPQHVYTFKFNSGTFGKGLRGFTG